MYVALLLLGALDAAGNSVIAPILPAIARRLDAGPAELGLLVASFPSAMTAAFAVGGQAVRSGRIPLLLTASLLTVAAGSPGFILGDSLVNAANLGKSDEHLEESAFGADAPSDTLKPLGPIRDLLSAQATGSSMKTPP